MLGDRLRPGHERDRRDRGPGAARRVSRERRRCAASRVGRPAGPAPAGRPSRRGRLNRAPSVRRRLPDPLGQRRRRAARTASSTRQRRRRPNRESHGRGSGGARRRAFGRTAARPGSCPDAFGRGRPGPRAGRRAGSRPGRPPRPVRGRRRRRLGGRPGPPTGAGGPAFRGRRRTGRRLRARPSSSARTCGPSPNGTARATCERVRLTARMSHSTPATSSASRTGTWASRGDRPTSFRSTATWDGNGEVTARPAPANGSMYRTRAWASGRLTSPAAGNRPVRAGGWPADGRRRGRVRTRPRRRGPGRPVFAGVPAARFESGTARNSTCGPSSPCGARTRTRASNARLSHRARPGHARCGGRASPAARRPGDRRGPPPRPSPGHAAQSAGEMDGPGFEPEQFLPGPGAQVGERGRRVRRGEPKDGPARPVLPGPPRRCGSHVTSPSSRTRYSRAAAGGVSPGKATSASVGSPPGG